MPSPSAAPPSPSLAERVARLEARQEIEELKYRYLHACDHKDPEEFRACFISEGADIDYGELGAFATVDDLVALFSRIAAARGGEGGHIVLDMHHALHPQITFHSPTEAAWPLDVALPADQPRRGDRAGDVRRVRRPVRRRKRCMAPGEAPLPHPVVTDPPAAPGVRRG